MKNLQRKIGEIVGFDEDVNTLVDLFELEMMEIIGAKEKKSGFNPHTCFECRNALRSEQRKALLERICEK